AHYFADDLDRALQDLGQVARLGQEHRQIVDDGELVDALAKLVFLVAQSRDRVGEEEEELDGGGAGVSTADKLPDQRAGLLWLDAEFFRKLREFCVFDAGENAVGQHADRAEALVADDDLRTVLAA